MTIVNNTKTITPQTENVQEYISFVEESICSTDNSLIGTLMFEHTTLKYNWLISMQEHINDICLFCLTSIYHCNESICRIVVLMLLLVVIHKNINHNLLLLFHAALYVFYDLLLVFVIVLDFSLKRAKSRSKTLKWKLNCSHHSEKFMPLNTTYNAFKVIAITTKI